MLGMWIDENESASFWARILSELQARGVEDVLIALIDGLTGFPEAIAAVFPKTQIHQCTVHLIRQSLKYVSYTDRKAVARDLKEIYNSPTESAAEAELTAFETGRWNEKYPTIALIWRRHWERIITVFQYPPQIRKMLYTTNAIESLNMQLRKIIKNRGHFPNDDSAIKLIFLALRNIIKKWRNGKLRDEYLNQHWFLSLEDAKRKIESWRLSYNSDRPHSALDGFTPLEFAMQHKQTLLLNTKLSA